MFEYLRNVYPAHGLHVFSGIKHMPNFNPDKDTMPPPAAVHKFRKAVADADGVLICTPEYAYGLPGAFKNALDWLVSSGEFIDKPVSAITASGRGEHAHASLLLVLGAMNARIVEGGTLLIPWFNTKLDATGMLADKQTENDLKNVFTALLNAIS